MPELRFPERLPTAARKTASRACPAHRAWVRRHCCSVVGCRQLPIECAHVRGGTDGGAGLKPSDKWTISLSLHHHREQHRVGETRFAAKYGLDLVALAEAFARRSPHWKKLI